MPTWAQALHDATVCLQDANAQLVVVVQPVVIGVVGSLPYAATSSLRAFMLKESPLSNKQLPV